MRTLYHLPLSPFSRKVRVALAEKDLAFELKIEKVWERRTEYLQLNPTGKVPVLDDDGFVLPESAVICEYLEETYPDPELFRGNAQARAEQRRLNAWFDLKFTPEVTGNLVFEKLMKPLLGQGGPDSAKLRAGRENVRYHLDYIDFLMARRNWLGGDSFSYADITAAAHLSVVDYLGDVPWDGHDDAKDWYARIKSRPSFRPVLEDRVPGVQPSAHYADLDF